MSIFRIFVCVGLAIVLVLSLVACSGDDDPKDAGNDVVDVGIQPDVKGADEPFGRACTTINQQCPDKDPDGFTLWCIALQGGTAGQGFCTRQCADNGVECYNTPNGQWAQCFIEDTSQGDAGPAKKYCGFLCQSESKTWACPGTLNCGKPNSQGTAVCLP